jgi:hypothetical protein
VIPAGLKISETVRNIDLMPTVLDLSGLPIPEKIHGQSLVPLMAAARQAAQGASGGSVPEIAATLGWTPQPAVTEKSMHPDGERPKDLESYGLVFDGWKLVHNPHRGDDRPEFELYDHRKDPLNNTNVIAAPGPPRSEARRVRWCSATRNRASSSRSVAPRAARSSLEPPPLPRWMWTLTAQRGGTAFPPRRLCERRASTRDPGGVGAPSAPEGRGPCRVHRLAFESPPSRHRRETMCW